MLKKQIIKYPAMTITEIQVSVPELRVVSERAIQWTIQRTIQQTLQKDLNMPCCVAAMKPLLTAKK